MPHPYETPKYGWLWICYLSRAAARPDDTFVVHAITKSYGTIRLKLFHGRKVCENDQSFANYAPASRLTTIKQHSPNSLAIVKAEGFDQAWGAIKIDKFFAALQAINVFVQDDSPVLSFNSLLTNEQAVALRTYVEAFKQIRTALVSNTLVLMRK